MPSTRTVPHTLTIMPTYKCTAACKDCCFHSNPDITHRIPQDRLLSYVDQATAFPSLVLIVVSGGEAFILGNDLVELIQRITDRGFLSRIVTNGYWAVNEKGARARLRPLVRAGLRELSFSTGDDHAMFVPLERILYGLNAALEFGVGVSLMIEQRRDSTITRQVFLQEATRFPAVLDAVKRGILTVPESPWMQFTDDSDSPAFVPANVLNRANLLTRQPCTSVIGSIVVTPHEQLGMCCGLPREDISDLNVGDLRRHSMVSLFDQHVHDVMKIWLAVEGPERMLAWAASKDPTIEWEDRYAHTCDACRALYSDSRVIAAIRDHGPEKIDAVLSLFAARDERVMAADGANRTNQLVADSAGAVPSIEPSGKRSERFIPLTAV